MLAMYLCFHRESLVMRLWEVHLRERTIESLTSLISISCNIATVCTLDCTTTILTWVGTTFPTRPSLFVALTDSQHKNSSLHYVQSNCGLNLIVTMWDEGLDELLAGQELPKDVWAEKVSKVIADIQVDDTPVLAVVERLGNYLSNDNDAPRTRSTALLAQVKNVHIQVHHKLNQSSTATLAPSLFCSHPSLHPLNYPPPHTHTGHKILPYLFKIRRRRSSFSTILHLPPVRLASHRRSSHRLPRSGQPPTSLPPLPL